MRLAGLGSGTGGLWVHSKASLLIVENLADSDDRWGHELAPRAEAEGVHHDGQNRANAPARRV